MQVIGVVLSSSIPLRGAVLLLFGQGGEPYKTLKMSVFNIFFCAVYILLENFISSSAKNAIFRKGSIDTVSLMGPSFIRDPKNSMMVDFKHCLQLK